MSTPAEAWMVSIAVRPGELRERVMFLGGAVLGLLVDAPSDVRPTEEMTQAALVARYAPS